MSAVPHSAYLVIEGDLTAIPGFIFPASQGNEALRSLSALELRVEMWWMCYLPDPRYENLCTNTIRGLNLYLRHCSG